MKKQALILASLAVLSLNAAEADYATQNNSADKAFNELEGKEQGDKDLELQKKELEIERLKLELKKKKMAEEKQKAQEPAPAPRPSRQSSSFYIGIESYFASGTQKQEWESSDTPIYDGITQEEHTRYTQKRLVLGFGRANENRLEIGLVNGKKFDSDIYINNGIDEGTGMDLIWNIVGSPLSGNNASPTILPFFKIGFGYGAYEFTNEFKEYWNIASDQIVAFEFKLGLGAYIQLNKNIEFSASYDYTGVAFEPIKYDNGFGTTITEKNSANIAGFNLGFNYHF